MKTLLISIAKKIGYVMATCIILAAIFVSISYLVTPLFDKHRTDFEKWASDLLRTPVTIRKVEISWYRYQPEISLNAVTILNKDTKEPILHIQKVRVFFSIPQSIFQAKFIPSGIMISGADINLRQSATGEISVQGFPAFGGFSGQPYQKETKMTDLLGWLSVPPCLILQDVNLRYVGSKGQKSFVTLYNLSLQNSGQRHVLLGKALLHQEIPTEVNLALQWVGNSVDPNNIKAKIYVYVSGLSLSQWLKYYAWQNWQVTHGIASAKIWAVWDKGKFTKIQSTFQLFALDLYSETNKQTHKINRLSGNIGLKRDGNNYVFAGDDLLLDLPSHLWPVNNFYISLAPDATGAFFPKVINLGYVDLEDMQSFLFSSAWLTPSTRQTLAKFQPKGSFQGVNMLFSGAWNDFRHVSFNGQFSQLSVSAGQKFPGMRNLSGAIKWDGAQGDLLLNSTRIAVQYDSFFTNPILLDQVTGESQFTIDQNNAWTASIPALHILTGDMSFNVNGKLISQQDKMPIADLNADITLQNVNHISRYLPSRILDPDLVKWMQSAFLSGAINAANMVIKGPLNNFPFDKGQGTFSFTGSLNNINLHYAPDWPDLEHLNGRLSVAGHQMKIDLDRAEIFHIPIGPVHGEISDLSNATTPTLEIQDSEIPLDLAQGLRFIKQSPLEKTMGSMFSDVAIQGPAILKLGLTVPLNDPEKTQARGDLNIKNGQINLVPWELKLDHLQGLLHFTESTTDAQNLQGQLFNKPFKLSLSTIQKSKETSVLRINLKNNLSMTDLEKWLKIPFTKIAKGSTNANVDIDFSAKEPITIHMSSNLVGLAIALPEQYAKKSDEAKDFTSEIIMPEQQQPLKMKVNYGNLLSAAMTLNRKKGEFNLLGVNLRFGSGTATWPEGAGLYITGHFDQLDAEKITAYSNQPDKTNLAGLKLRDIDIHADEINIFGQQLKNVRLEAAPSENDWDLRITSPDVIGQIKAPEHFTSQGLISAQFQRLNLRSIGNSNLPTTINVKSLPSISLTANNVSYDNMFLGQITFKADAVPDGLDIQTFRILSPRMDLQATGSWTENNTHLEGRISSQHMSDLVDGFGFDVHNFVAGTATLNFDLGWRAALYAPALASMNGRASLNVGPGRIVDVGAAGGAKMDLGRMLSIFSLQSIPRRLSLDFSDVFHKGYSFDSVKGDFSLQNGNAYTNNLRFNGPIAGVFINGRIGFSTKDYDLILSITPYVSSVTSGLPVAATIIGGPIGGVAALAVNTVLGSAVSQVATHSYAVRGPWSNPSWISVNNTRR